MRSLPLLLPALLLAACDNMQHQANRRPLTPSPLFADGASARHPPAHTVSADLPEPAVPERLDPLARLQRGRALFDADCGPCHGPDGYGQGIVVRRGFPQPESLHAPRERSLSNEQIFAAISAGKGVMYPLADRLVPEDRWLIVAYVRALQRSQHAALNDVPESARKELAGP